MDDEDDSPQAREFRRMKARLEELELLCVSLAPERVPTATSWNDQRCSFHLHVIVHEHAAIVECSQCHQPLDPLEVLRQFAKRERRFADSLEHLRKEQRDLLKQIEALKKQRNSLRSAVRRVGGTPLEPWDLKDE